LSGSGWSKVVGRRKRREEKTKKKKREDGKGDDEKESIWRGSRLYALPVIDNTSGYKYNTTWRTSNA
jgi:hypothetical protein